MFLYGSSGTGKTLLSSEAVKIKLSQFKQENKPVRVIVTSYYYRDEKILLENFRTQYFPNMKDIRVLPLEELCKELRSKYYYCHPKENINNTVMKLSEDKEVTTIFMCDEIYPCDSSGQTTPDWSNIRVEDNIVWVLSVRPASSSYEMSSMKPPPQSSKILTIKLVHGHRNCKEIRLGIIASFFISFQS